MPIGWRATIGTRVWPPNMKRALAAWLTSSSTAQSAKSEKRISTTGRVPIIAAPTAAPMMQASEIGVSTMRSGPKLVDQALILAEDAAASEILAKRPDGGVRAHGLGEGQAAGFEISEFSHGRLALPGASDVLGIEIGCFRVGEAAPPRLGEGAAISSFGVCSMAAMSAVETPASRSQPAAAQSAGRASSRPRPRRRR